MIIALVVVAYLATCYLSWGLTLGYFTHRYPYFKNTNTLWLCIGGPCALIVALCHPPYHWRIRPPDKEERWAAHQKAWPQLTREYFEANDTNL